MPDRHLVLHKREKDLTATDRRLLKRAMRNQKLAYAPYSGFLVGVALRTNKGDIVDGANQENASYPLCMCGERVALYQSAMLHANAGIDTMAIVAHGRKKLKSPAPPCGACLQVMREFESRQKNQPIRLLLKADTDLIWEVPSVAAMLPFSFDGSYL